MADVLLSPVSPSLSACASPTGEQSPDRLAAPAASSSLAIREGVRVPDILQHCIDCLCPPCYVPRKYCYNERCVIISGVLRPLRYVAAISGRFRIKEMSGGVRETPSSSGCRSSCFGGCGAHARECQ